METRTAEREEALLRELTAVAWKRHCPTGGGVFFTKTVLGAENTALAMLCSDLVRCWACCMTDTELALLVKRSNPCLKCEKDIIKRIMVELLVEGAQGECGCVNFEVGDDLVVCIERQIGIYQFSLPLRAAQVGSFEEDIERRRNYQAEVLRAHFIEPLLHMCDFYQGYLGKFVASVESLALPNDIPAHRGPPPQLGTAGARLYEQIMDSKKDLACLDSTMQCVGGQTVLRQAVVAHPFILSSNSSLELSEEPVAQKKPEPEPEPAPLAPPKPKKAKTKKRGFV